ncbi:prolyl oligopeptidase family serine peptidase [Microbacterium sp.]|uniref:S9 family peptidase n=1 Tax=Microbacterium sp. TaxID=51671 RepID=UPI002899552B|nr:prolyl oligopeptidase family serine peptidase [Microbacterium sp.]
MTAAQPDLPESLALPSLPYGSWPSPLTAEWASAASPRLEGAAFVGDEIWWGQSVPAEGGRTGVFRRAGDAATTHTVLPAPWSARSAVHDYGGGAWAATDDGRLFFVEKSDQQVWLQRPGGTPQPLTTDPDHRFGGLRWAAGTLLAVRERAAGGADAGSAGAAGAAADAVTGAATRAIVAIDVATGQARTLATGTDFVAQPALSPDGALLAWIGWDDPDMPWDRTRLRVARVDGDSAADPVDVAGGSRAILQPEWRDERTLVFLDDTTGFWNPWQASADAGIPPNPLAPADADTGGPLWSLGMRWYGVLDGGRMLAVRSDGADRLVLIDADGGVSPVALPATGDLLVEAVRGHEALVSGTAPETSGIWLVDADAGTARQVVGEPLGIDGGWLPGTAPLTVSGPTGDVHAFVHPPTSPVARGADGERPPYLVLVHGGPTGRATGVADSRVLFFTSRGIGVLEVNYGGSTGYGRAYRERLRGQWGVVDVADVAAAASGLAATGAADPARLAIKGGSAGGWTVLAALARTDVFAAGISRYGVGDPRALVAASHGFEGHYLDCLIGPLPEAEEVYRERSPLTHIAGFDVPVLLLQGSDDPVVPPSQAEAIRDALAAHGVPHAYVRYEGEGHGFRRAETIVHALETELAFLGQVFGFETPGIPPVTLT